VNLKVPDLADCHVYAAEGDGAVLTLTEERDTGHPDILAVNLFPIRTSSQ
jgi:hypothetical protein